MTKFSSRRPLSWCSTHRQLYCRASRPGRRALSKLSMRACFCSGGRSVSANDSTPLVYFFAYRLESISAATSSGSPRRRVAPSRCPSRPRRYWVGPLPPPVPLA